MVYHVIFPWRQIVIAVLAFSIVVLVPTAESANREFDTLDWYEMGQMDPADFSSSSSNDETFKKAIVRGTRAFRGTGERIGQPTTLEEQKRKKKDAGLRVSNIICGNEKFSMFCDLLNNSAESNTISSRTIVDFDLDFMSEFTLFAPTNIAFAKQSLVTSLPEGLSIDDFLNVHILDRALSMSQLSKVCFYQLPTRFGDEPTRTICDLDGTPLFQTGEGNIARDRPRFYGGPFVDIRVRNGFIHAIDDFIKPIQFLGTEQPSTKASNAPSPVPTTSVNIITSPGANRASVADSMIAESEEEDLEESADKKKRQRKRRERRKKRRRKDRNERLTN